MDEGTPAGPPAGNPAARLRRIALVGAESTGKTTLAEALARELRTVWVPEALRLWVDREGRIPALNDMAQVLGEQLALEAAFAAKAREFLVCDTCPLVLAVLCRHYLGTVPAEVEEATRSRVYDLYVLTEPDIPWVADGIMRDGEPVRKAIHDAFVDEMKSRRIPYLAVTGAVGERVRQVLAALAVRGTRPERPSE